MNDMEKYDADSEKRDELQVQPEKESEIHDPNPQWYGISYGTDEPSGSGFSVAKKSGRRKKRIALVSVCLILSLMIAAVAGFGGYMIANGNRDNTYDNKGGMLTSGTNEIAAGDVYSSGNAASYAYSEVVIGKNDGSALVGSVSGSAGENAGPRIQTVAAVKDSVVEITATATTRRGITAGAGSGVIIHSDGIIVTNNHVVSGYTTIYVRLTNGHTYEAYVRGVDEDHDIAVLKIDPQETLTVAKLGSSASVALGEDVIAIGNPLGQLGGTVTEGIISGLEREIQVEGYNMKLMQTSAAINAGNSGGGLFNMAGELIGIVNAKYSAEGVEGLGFAIPIDTAYTSICNLLKYGYIPGTPALGVTVTEQTVSFGYYYRTMLYVYEAKEGSTLQTGDYIDSIDGVTVSSTEELRALIHTHSVGDTVTVSVYRNKTKQTVQVTLVEYIPANASVSFNTGE